MAVMVSPRFVAEYIPSRKVSPFRSEGWWLNRWPYLGWLETFLKLFAWYFAWKTPVDGVGGLFSGEVGGDGGVGGGVEGRSGFRWETLVMQVLTGLMIAAIGDRIFYREIISMLFIFPQMGSHLIVTRAMMKGREATSVRDLRVFLWLQFLGDLTKLAFFIVHDFNIKRVARTVPIDVVHTTPVGLLKPDRLIATSDLASNREFGSLISSRLQISHLPPYPLLRPETSVVVLLPPAFFLLQVLYALVSLFFVSYALVLWIDYSTFGRLHSFQKVAT